MGRVFECGNSVPDLIPLEVAGILEWPVRRHISAAAMGGMHGASHPSFPSARREPCGCEAFSGGWPIVVPRSFGELVVAPKLGNQK